MSNLRNMKNRNSGTKQKPARIAEVTKVASAVEVDDSRQCERISDDAEKTVKEAFTDSEMWEKFELEIRWCLQQLQLQLDSKRLNPKQSEQTAKILMTLANPKTPLVKKRQVMRATFGDYRDKMKRDETRLEKAMKNMCVSEVKANKQKGTFVRKCADKIECEDTSLRFQQDGNYYFKKSDNAFRFGFSTPEDATK